VLRADTPRTKHSDGTKHSNGYFLIERL
jgi:hypothetical protein